MKPRPTIFISGVSSEFREFRDAVENEIEMKGCFAENLPGFPPDYRTVEEMLRRKIYDSDAVVHIVGSRYGTEPNQLPADKPRRSYTQMEFDIAKELKKPVYVFLSKDASVRDPAQPDEQPDDPEAVVLQLAHRHAVQGTNQLFYSFKDKAELCKLVAETPVIAAAEFRVDVSRILKYAPAQLIGRDDELKRLDDAWLKVRRCEAHRPHVLTFVALGGEGKTSLVSKWVANLAHENWPGCDAAFAWSFYSQGTREQAAVSSDLFLAEALTFFGDEAMAKSAAGAFDKGRRLAQLVGERRALLILDGLEPLQYAPSSPTPGELKDQGLAALLKGLGATSHGLCVVTTRYALPDLRAFWQTTAPEVPLLRLSPDAGAHLLKTLGVTGAAQEFAALVEDVKGHALTLTLLGGFLKRAFHGDIRQRDRVKFEKADEKMDGGHAFRTMAAYEQWLLRDGGDEGRREVAVLRLMGLFDRPADADCLAALRRETIPGLTEPLTGLADDDWEFCLSGFEAAKLLTVNRDVSGALVSLDAHPHLREYFARQLRNQQPEAWRAAHGRIYDYLCVTAPECTRNDWREFAERIFLPNHENLYARFDLALMLAGSINGKPLPKSGDLQKLYQAIFHGCRAGRDPEVLERVYIDRIQRGGRARALYMLGEFGACLTAIASFFTRPWNQISGSLSLPATAWIFCEASHYLRSLGRIKEAVEPAQEALAVSEAAEDWRNAALGANHLSLAELLLGDLKKAVNTASKAAELASRADYRTGRIQALLTAFKALHDAGRAIEAEARIREVWAAPDVELCWELVQLYHCDQMASAAEHNAWQEFLGCTGPKPPIPPMIKTGVFGEITHSECCRGAYELAEMLLADAETPRGIGIYNLTMSRLALYRHLRPELNPLPTDHLSLETATDRLAIALANFSSAHEMDLAVRSLLTRAWLRFLTGPCTGPESAQADLDEAWEIAERGPMKLFLADIHLYRARLFFREKEYPWNKHPDGSARGPKDDLDAAEKLINACGYHRRDEELADAKRAILGAS